MANSIKSKNCKQPIQEDLIPETVTVFHCYIDGVVMSENRKEYSQSVNLIKLIYKSSYWTSIQVTQAVFIGFPQEIIIIFYI